jgi:hypothetical protein
MNSDQENIFKRHPFLAREDNLANIASVAIRSSGLILSSFGLAAFSLNKLSKTIRESETLKSLTEDSTMLDVIEMLPSDMNAIYTVLAGGVLHGILKFAVNKQSKIMEDMTAKGADRLLYNNHFKLNPCNHMKYKYDLSKKVYSSHLFKFLDNLRTLKTNAKQLFSDKELDNPYFNINDYDQKLVNELFTDESINALHLTAFLGDSNTEIAKSIKDNNVVASRSIKEIFNNSEDLCKLLSDNIPSLRSMMKNIESSLGTDAEFIIKNSRNYSEGRNDFFEICVDAIKNTGKKYQQYNVHQEFCTILENIHNKSKDKTLTKTDLDKNLEKLRNFKNLVGFETRNNPYENVVETALSLADKLSKLDFDKNKDTLYKEIRKFTSKDKDKELSSISDQIFHKQFSENISKPLNIKSEVTKEIFKELEKKAKASFDANDDFDPVRVLNLSKSKKSDMVESYSLDPLKEIKSSEAAKKTVLNIQRRLAAKIINDKNEEIGY